MDSVVFIVLMALAAPPASQPATAPVVSEFCFVQVSDSHVSPHPASLASRPELRGKASIDWFCAEAGKPQRMEPFGITTPPPAFAIHTGDITEYGVIDETWKDVEAAFAALPVPMYYVPGNHDNTWVAMHHILVDKYDAPQYSFDQFGCHFVGLSSATLQEPSPSFDAAAIWWLRADLSKVNPQTPVFLFFHHPPDGNEFAQPAEWARLYEAIREHNVVLLLYGHGHGARHQAVDGIDGVMGGSTYGDDAGYNVISVKDGMLRVAYRFFEPGKGMKKLVEKPLKPPAGPVLDVNLRDLEMFGVRGGKVSFTPKTTGPVKSATRPADSTQPAGEPRYQVTIDGAEVKFAKGKGAAFDIPTTGLTPGGHTLVIRADNGDGTQFLGMRATQFFVETPTVEVAWRRYLPASVKAGPLVLNDPPVVLVAETAGPLRAIDRNTTAQRWEFPAGPLLSSPALDRDGIVFGSGDGLVYRIGLDGKLVWTYDAKVPVFGSPVVADGTVYIGDNSGRLHALDAGTGQARWVFERATQGIECRPAIMGDRILFGAWDSYLYCVSRKDGKLVWKSLSAKAAEGKAPQYYSPADCGPVVLGDRIFVCDRGYMLASFSADGKMGPVLAKDVSAIAAAADGRAFYARCLEDRVVKFDAEGQTVWEAKVPAGRLPVPPTERDGRLYVCSNTGLLSVLDAEKGTVLWSYQTTPGFYVMAPVAVDAEGYCIVIGMDGTIARLRQKPG